MRMLRWACGWTRLDRVRNEDVKADMGTAPVHLKMRANAQVAWSYYEEEEKLCNDDRTVDLRPGKPASRLGPRKLESFLSKKDISDGMDEVSAQRLESMKSRLQYIERSFLDPIIECIRTTATCIIDPATKYHIAHNETHLHSLAMDITKVQYAVESAIDALD
ncbi:unnamed protein product [Nippostrongylus brasiliensis]|uniref:GIT1_C domain-containing protein n=1 Tax=Nippostrongylus brasiliensis TaxID=27835 RepID=A0A0N4YLB6_NIPBR|nr:unnamed protein product [Nippostrongylus brasiliensis]